MAIADAVALVAFVLLGMASHHDVSWTVGVARNLVPLLLAWFLMAGLLGTYRRPSPWRLLANWLLAVPAGLLLRSLVVGDPTGSRLVIFVTVGLAVTLPLLLIGRLLGALLTGGVPAEPRDVLP